MDQPAFAELEFRCKKHKTPREPFLERMDALVPWQHLEDRIRPVYPKAGPGRQPYPLTVMLRIHCVQLFYNPSNPGHGGPPFSRGKALLYETESVRRSVGLKLSRALSNETDILNFRHLLERHSLGARLSQWRPAGPNPSVGRLWTRYSPARDEIIGREPSGSPDKLYLPYTRIPAQERTDRQSRPLVRESLAEDMVLYEMFRTAKDYGRTALEGDYRKAIDAARRHT